MGLIKSSIKISCMLICMFFLINACQSLPVRAPEDVLRNRVTSLMEGRVSQDWGAVYQYLDSRYKKKISREKFVNVDRNIVYSNFSIDAIQIGSSGTKAVVNVKYDMNLMSFDVEGHLEKQRWIKQDGKWYLEMSDESPMEKN